MRQVQAQMAVHGATWFAWYQNAGKGQREKQWKAEPGLNLMMSCVIEPSCLTLENQFYLNVCVALACHQLVTSQVNFKTSVKWPNDIYWNDRKAGGILIENMVQGKEWKFAIVGIGLNVNQTVFPGSLRNAVSMKQITGKTFDAIDLAKQLCKNLDARWRQLCAGYHEQLLSEYNAAMYKSGEKVRFKKGDQVFEATINGVNKSGELILATGEGRKITLVSGAIEWLLP